MEHAPPRQCLESQHSSLHCKRLNPNPNPNPIVHQRPSLLPRGSVPRLCCPCCHLTPRDSQVESARFSSPRVGIGTEGRQQHTGKRNPVYADTLFPSVPAVGPQVFSGKRSYPNVKIGTDPRFRDGPDDSAPGPGSYKSRASVGPQVNSYLRSMPSRTFGVRHSPKANCKDGDISTVVSPGPAGYRLRDSLGRQVNSKNKTSSHFSFGTASRFSSKELAGTPGPGAYTV